MRAEPKGKSMDSPIMPLLAQILEVQRLFRDKVIEELPLPARKARINNYILECERILFSPRLFREIGVRLATLLASQNPGTDFLPLISNLEDSILEALAVTVQDCLEPDLVLAMEIAVNELRLQKLCPLDPQVLAGFFLAALVPFYTAFAQQQMLDLADWQRGWCPVCGQYPVNGYNRPVDGRRILGCWMCETEWTYSRMVCPVCSSSRQDGQLLLTLVGDCQRRIQVCDDCGYYLKITDCTQASAGCDLQLENAATVFLDILAQRKGYRPASHPHIYDETVK